MKNVKNTIGVGSAYGYIDHTGLSLRTKLIMGFLSMVVLIIFMGLLLLKNDKALQADFNALVSINLGEVSHASQTAFLVQSIKSNFREFMLESIINTNHDEIEHAHQEIENDLLELGRVSKHWQMIVQDDLEAIDEERHSTVLENEELQNVHKLQIIIDEFVVSCRRLLDMIAQNPASYRDHHDYFEDEVEPVSRLLQDKVRDLWDDALDEAYNEQLIFTQILNNNISIAQFLSLAAFLLAIGLALFFANSFLNRLAQLHQALQQIERGNFDTSIISSGNDEIADLAVAFNNMSLSLKQNIDARINIENELRKLNNDLQSSKQQLTKAQAIAKIGHWSLDLSDNKITGSRMLYQLLALNEEENLPDNFVQVIYPEYSDWAAINLQGTITNKKGWDKEYRISLCGEQERWIHSIGDLITDEAGKVIQIVGTIQDITERKQIEFVAQSAREMAETANRAKSTFLANMSHELRTPLNAILGFAEMIGRDYDIPKTVHEKVAIITRSGNHLLNMINDVLDLSKIEAGREELELEEVCLPCMLQEIGQMFEVRSKDAQLSFEMMLDPALAKYIKTDVGKLRQIIINLLANAVKFTVEGGFSLRAQTWSTKTDSSMVVLQIDVQDSGPGIAADQLEYIFQPFVQAGHSASSTKGTGLGLAISQSFLNLMDGEVSVESQLGAGTLFRIELPVALAHESEVAENSSPPPVVFALEPNQPIWSILVVEDNDENRLLLSSQLKQVGFDVREAENGKEAIALIKQRQPHFIWMDMCMPVMDGYEATANIRALPDGGSMKIVAITANVFKEQQQKILQAGCDEVIFKPYQSHEIFAVMSKHLGVNYLYQEQQYTIKSEVPSKLTAERLLQLPVELQEMLLEAAQMLDVEATIKVAEKVRQIDPELAVELQKQVQEFRFEHIFELYEAQKAQSI